MDPTKMRVYSKGYDIYSCCESLILCLQRTLFPGDLSGGFEEMGWLIPFSFLLDKHTQESHLKTTPRCRWIYTRTIPDANMSPLYYTWGYSLQYGGVKTVLNCPQQVLPWTYMDRNIWHFYFCPFQKHGAHPSTRGLEAQLMPFL